MVRWLWVILAVCLSSSIYLVVRYGLRPKPIPVMNPTRFERLDQVGVVTYKRLRQNLRAERILLVGISPEVRMGPEIWRGFVRAAMADGQKLALYRPATGLAVEESWPNGVSIQEYDPIKVEESGFARDIQSQIHAGMLLVVLAETRETSHLVTNSISRRLESVLGRPVLSVSVLNFSVLPPPADEPSSQCLDASEDNTGQVRLACAVHRVQRKFLKRHLDPQRIWGIIERHGLKEYLLFIYQAP